MSAGCEHVDATGRNEECDSTARVTLAPEGAESVYQERMQARRAHSQHGASRSAADRVAAKGVEVQLATQRLRDRGRGHHRCKRQPVADAFGHRHDVWLHAVALEAPEVVAGAAKAGLHLVGDADASSRADRLQQRSPSQWRAAARFAQPAKLAITVCDWSWPASSIAEQARFGRYGDHGVVVPLSAHTVFVLCC